MDRVLRSATEVFSGGGRDSNRLLEQCHEIAEAEYGNQEDEESLLLRDTAVGATARRERTTQSPYNNNRDEETEEVGNGSSPRSGVDGPLDEVREFAEEGFEEESSRYDNLFTDDEVNHDIDDDEEDDEADDDDDDADGSKDDDSEDSDDSQETLSEMEDLMERVSEMEDLIEREHLQRGLSPIISMINGGDPFG